MAPTKGIYRIKSDIKTIMRDPPHGIFGVPDELNIKIFHAIITGPEGTPYENGFFYFVVTFPDNYPHSPPDVKFMTTGGGTVRFNPNLYTDGKVCVSILGTWHGPSWSVAHTLSSVLISIQSLLNDFPYHNEPGYEKEKFEGAALQYNAVIMHETLRVAVLGMVRNDAGLTMPICLEQHIQQEFVKNFDFYAACATQRSSLSGNIIEDPLFPSYSSQQVFKYNDLLEELRELKEQFHIEQ